MKNHFIAIVLLTIISAKLISMENKPLILQEDKIEQAVIKLYNFVKLSPEQTLNPQPPFFALPCWINATENQTDLRDGVFAVTTLIFAAQKKENSENSGISDFLANLKAIRKSMYNRLTTLLSKDEKKFPTQKEAKSAAKIFCWGVIDDISDDEDNENNEKNNYTQNNFNKYKDFKNKILNTEIETNKSNALLASVQNKQKATIFEIEALTKQLEIAGQTNNELNKQIVSDQKEIDALKTAHEILENQAADQLNKMLEQRKWLIGQIDTTEKYITRLQKEWPGPTDNDIASKNIGISKAHAKLTRLQNTLLYLDKNIAEAKGETGIVSNFLWQLGFHNYSHAEYNDLYDVVAGPVLIAQQMLDERK